MRGSSFVVRSSWYFTHLSFPSSPAHPRPRSPARRSIRRAANQAVLCRLAVDQSDPMSIVGSRASLPELHVFEASCRARSPRDKGIHHLWRPPRITSGRCGGASLPKRSSMHCDSGGELRMEGCAEDPTLPHEDRLTAEGRNHARLPYPDDPRGADENERERAVVRRRLEAVALASVSVARDAHVEKPEAPLRRGDDLASGENESGAHGENRFFCPNESEQRRFESESQKERKLHSAFAARKNETIG